MKHTPGPWEVVKKDDMHDNSSVRDWCIGSRDCITVETEWITGWGCPQSIALINNNNGDMNGEANARLIAAAPDMEDRLLCMQEFLAGLVHGEYRPEDIPAIADRHWDSNDVVLAKAKGES